MDFCLLIAAVTISLVVRFIFIKFSSSNAVDHYYWILVTRLFRKKFSLPVRLEGKYLLESDKMAYPIGFGLFLSLFSEKFLRSSKSKYVTTVIDLMALIPLSAIGMELNLNLAGFSAMIIVYGLAPILVSYNTQLTSRSLGNLFLLFSLCCQFFAVVEAQYFSLLYLFFGIIFLTATLVTHKMTTQFYIFLLPGWIYSLHLLGGYGATIAAISPLLAIVLAFLVTGFKYQKLQWIAHWDIVSFWNRNWRFLGAHQFRHSEIYGKPSERDSSTFHKKGTKGVLKHCSLLFAHLPAVYFLPMYVFFEEPVPLIIATPIIIAMLLAASTLLLQPLRCLGGGHLYLFNAVPFVSLAWGVLLTTHSHSMPLIAIFSMSISLTLLSLYLGSRKRKAASSPNSKNLNLVIKKLSNMRKQNIAVFPVTYAEIIALETEHSVFWGGHGLGFRELEPFWPIMRKRVSVALSSYNISTIILDLDFWPEGGEVLAVESGDSQPKRYGNFLVYEVSQ